MELFDKFMKAGPTAPLRLYEKYVPIRTGRNPQSTYFTQQRIFHPAVADPPGMSSLCGAHGAQTVLGLARLVIGCDSTTPGLRVAKGRPSAVEQGDMGFDRVEDPVSQRSA